MSFDTGLLEQLIEINKRGAPKCLLRLDGLNYAVTDVLIMNSRIPVNKPTTRGGAYFSEKFAYKISGTIRDLAVVPLLTKQMLGPNTEFGNLNITAQAKTGQGHVTAFEISANLINSVQTPDSIQLHMIIVDIKSVN